MKNLKLNKLAENRLNEKEMKNLTGGYKIFETHVGTNIKSCGCGCYYANQGGSSTNDNGGKNHETGLWSPMR